MNRVADWEVCEVCHASSDCKKCCRKCEKYCDCARQECGLKDSMPIRVNRVVAWRMKQLENKGGTVGRRYKVNTGGGGVALEEAPKDQEDQVEEQKKEIQYHQVYGKYVFTEEEKKEIAAKLAEKTIENQRFEDEKKAITSSFKSKIDACQAEINLKAGHLSTGYTFKYYKCTCEIDRRKKIKRFIDVETKAVIEEKPMSQDDLQQKFDL